MKKSIVLWLCFLLYLPFLSLSQDNKVIWGGPSDKNSKTIHHPQAIIGKDETGLYLISTEVKINSATVSLVKYDLNMNYLWTVPLEAKISKKETNYVGLIIANDKMVLFTSEYDKTTKIKKIFAGTISKTGVIDASRTQVHTFENVISLYDVIVEVEFDEKKSFIVMTSARVNESKNKFIQAFTLNENFTIRSKEEFEEPIIEQENIMATTETPSMLWLTKLSDNEHNFYYAYSTIDQESKEKNIESYLTIFNQKTKEKKQYELKIDNYQLTDFNISLDTLSGRYLRIYGYYADKKESGLLGTFLFKFDLLNKKTDSVSVKPFDKNLLHFVSTIHIADGKPNAFGNNESTFKDYSIRFILEKNDEIIMISEQSNATHSSVPASSSNPSYAVSTWHYKNILITTFDSKGNAKWNTVIPKYQKTIKNYNSGSIGSFIYKDELYVMYLDDPQNGQTISPNQYTCDDLGKAAFVFINVNESGNMKKNIELPAPTETKGTVISAEFFKVLDNELFLLGREGEVYKLGKLTLK